MRRLYLEPEEFTADEVRLTGPRAHRLGQVLRLRAGAIFAVFDGLGAERAATVASVRGASVTLTLGEALPATPEPPVPVVLVCAFPRASRGDWLVEKATEIGVAQIVPLEADRSVLRVGEGRIARWQRIAIEAAEQCGRAVVPRIGGEPPAGALLVVADPETTVTAREQFARLTPPPGAVVLQIGPEGGWSTAELKAFDRAGALHCTLGPRLMRVETAAILAAAQLLELTGGLAGNVPAHVTASAPPSRG